MSDSDDNQKRASEIMAQLHIDVALLKQRVMHLAELVENFVTKWEFMPVKMIAYGMAGALLAGVVAALLATVIRHP